MGLEERTQIKLSGSDLVISSGRRDESVSRVFPFSFPLSTPLPSLTLLSSSVPVLHQSKRECQKYRRDVMHFRESEERKSASARIEKRRAINPSSQLVLSDSFVQQRSLGEFRVMQSHGRQ